MSEPGFIRLKDYWIKILKSYHPKNLSSDKEGLQDHYPFFHHQKPNNQKMEFNPNNPIVKLCLAGMAMEEKGKPTEAAKLFQQAWEDATNDFEKFLATHYIARHQNNVSDRLQWLETSLNLALKLDDDTVRSAFSAL